MTQQEVIGQLGQISEYVGYALEKTERNGAMYQSWILALDEARRLLKDRPVQPVGQTMTVKISLGCEDR